MKIFTFWHNRNEIPGYLKLCVSTWHKFIHDNEIILLDFSNLSEYTDIQRKNYYDELVSGKYNMAQVSDVLRFDILSINDGVWMDMDTIVTSNEFERTVLNEETDLDATVFGNNDWRVGITFIKAKHDSKFINYVKSEQIKRLESKASGPFVWSYLANQIYIPYVKDHVQDFRQFDFMSSVLETRIEKAYGSVPYKKLWFEKQIQIYELGTLPQIITLHNAWTPKHVKKMDESTFLEHNFTLANVLRSLNEDSMYNFNS